MIEITPANSVPVALANSGVVERMRFLTELRLSRGSLKLQLHGSYVKYLTLLPIIIRFCKVNDTVFSAAAPPTHALKAGSMLHTASLDAALIAPAARNTLLSLLPHAELAKLAPWLEPVELELGSVIYHPDVHIEHVYFPTNGAISTVVVATDGELEVSSVGNEGFVGVAALLHASSVPTRAFVQAKGRGYRVEVEVFRAIVAESLAMQKLFCRYTLAIMNQLAQSAACNRMHSLEARCARWLLMAHDRADGGQIALTQTELSYMLGVHRPAVTLAAMTFQKAGLIHYTRGKIVVTDRAGLELASCSCYQTLRDGFASLVGPPSASS